MSKKDTPPLKYFSPTESGPKPRNLIKMNLAHESITSIKAKNKNLIKIYS